MSGLCRVFVGLMFTGKIYKNIIFVKNFNNDKVYPIHPFIISCFYQ